MASLIDGKIKIMNKRSQQEKEAMHAKGECGGLCYLAVALHQASSWTKSSSR